MKQTLSLVLDPHAKLFHYVNKSGGVYDLTKKAMSGSNDDATAVTDEVHNRSVLLWKVASSRKCG